MGPLETFPEYIDYLGTERTPLISAPKSLHSAVLNYVMGERALRHEDATAEDLSTMAAIVQGALEAGALGFSTSRTIGHRSVLGEPIPGTFAEKEELLTIGHAIKAAGHGYFKRYPQAWSGILQVEHWTTEQEVELFTDIARTCGVKCTFTLAQNGSRPDQWRSCLDLVEQAQNQGLNIVPQIATRPIGFVTSLRPITCLCDARPT